MTVQDELLMSGEQGRAVFDDGDDDDDDSGVRIVASAVASLTHADA